MSDVYCPYKLLLIDRRIVARENEPMTSTIIEYYLKEQADAAYDAIVGSIPTRQERLLVFNSRH